MPHVHIDECMWELNWEDRVVRPLAEYSLMKTMVKARGLKRSSGSTLGLCKIWTTENKKDDYTEVPDKRICKRLSDKIYWHSTLIVFYCSFYKIDMSLKNKRLNFNLNT